MFKCYIIAEAGVNHNGSLELAKQLIDVASDAKADAVKFQTFKANKLISINAPKAEYQITCKRPGNGISPLLYWEYLGKIANKNYFQDEMI